MASFQKPDDDYVDIGSMTARSVPEIAPGVGFCDEDEEELGILVVGLAYVEYVECGFHPSEFCTVYYVLFWWFSSECVDH